VERGKGQWACPLHMVPKPNNEWRPCGDYRRLNAVTVPDRYPIPHVQDFAAKLAGTTVFTKIDLVKGYHQVPVEHASQEKTAIVTPFGLFQYRRMPFGLRNATQTFQRLMDVVIQPVPAAMVYIDDVLVASRTEEVLLTIVMTIVSNFC